MRTEVVDEWHIVFNMAQMSLAKSLQLDYNLKGQYLPVLKKTQLHKLLFVKKLGRGQKYANVFNERYQLVSDIDCLVITWML